jgi:hypothetical protein
MRLVRAHFPTIAFAYTAQHQWWPRYGGAYHPGSPSQQRDHFWRTKVAGLLFHIPSKSMVFTFYGHFQAIL